MGDSEESKPSRFELLLEHYLDENRRKRAGDEAKRASAPKEGPRVSLPREASELLAPKTQGRREKFDISNYPRPRPAVSFGIPSHGDQPFVPPTPPVFGSDIFANSQWDTVPNRHVSRPNHDKVPCSNTENVQIKVEAPFNQPTQPTTTSHVPSRDEEVEPEEPSSPVKRRHCTCSVGKPCELAAEKGVEDCRSVVPEKHIRRRQSMANPL